MLSSLVPFLIPAALLVVVFFAQLALRKHYDYQCANCGHAFSPSVWAMVLTPHRFGDKLLKCPQCGKVTWAERVPKK
jgi:predicted RNA-binding Zn-ribbon protein involved in translation (DUF1610 family)